jgi:hypothetical protein
MKKGEHQKLYMRQYALDNKEKLDEYQKQYRLIHKEEMREYHKQHYIKHREEKREYKKQYNISHRKERRERGLKMYGLTPEQYDEMFAKQNGCCAICGKHQKRFKQTLNVDHNHITGKIRELLCHSCNSAIGLMKDSKIMLNKALLYLEKHNG